MKFMSLPVTGLIASSLALLTLAAPGPKSPSHYSRVLTILASLFEDPELQCSKEKVCCVEIIKNGNLGFGCMKMPTTKKVISIITGWPEEMIPDNPTCGLVFQDRDSHKAACCQQCELNGPEDWPSREGACVQCKERKENPKGNMPKPPPEIKRLVRVSDDREEQCSAKSKVCCRHLDEDYDGPGLHGSLCLRVPTSREDLETLLPGYPVGKVPKNPTCEFLFRNFREPACCGDCDIGRDPLTIGQCGKCSIREEDPRGNEPKDAEDPSAYL